MRYLYIGLIVAFTALVLLFKFQNLETATVSLFSASVTLPLSVLVLRDLRAGHADGRMPAGAAAHVDQSRQAIFLKRRRRTRRPGGIARLSILRLPLAGETA